MSKYYDVVIVGGAVMGSSAAYWLARLSEKDLKICVVERDKSYAQSSTALSAASIRQQFTNPINVEISRFGIDFIRNFSSELGAGAGVDTLGFKENGYLFLAGSENGESVLREAAEMQSACGARTELLTPGHLKRRFDWMNTEDIRLASFGPEREGWFDNMGLLHGFRRAAIAMGVQFIEGEITGVKKTAGTVTAVTLGSGEQISAASFINAAGTRAADILRMIHEDIPVEPRKRTVFMIDAPNAIHPDAPMIVDFRGYYIRPENQHWICATVPSQDVKVAHDDFEPDLWQFEDQIWPELYARSEGFDAVKVLSAWAGHYAFNKFDQNAILGPHPVYRNFYLMNGFSGHGLQQAPAVGRGIAEHILTGKYQTLDLSQLGIERIYENRPFLEKAIV